MSALTIRLPDDNCRRLKGLSQRRHTSVNRLIDEMAFFATQQGHRGRRPACKSENGLAVVGGLSGAMLVVTLRKRSSRPTPSCKSENGVAVVGGL